MSDDQQPYDAESVDDSDSPLTEQPTLPPQKASDASVDEATLPPRDSTRINNIGKPERETQRRMIALLGDELSYRFLGDWTDCDGNARPSLCGGRQG